MRNNVHGALFMWLEIADWHYLEGRLLFQHKLVTGACELLWLSVEQMMKILLVKKEINSIISIVTDLEGVCKIIDKKGKHYGHNAVDLVENLDNEYAA
ncbi:MAG: hypothetical protein ABR985_02040 [Methanotrichaceae archaeon]|jgi:uncharacterized protein Yka (UPF0111/DUF47 family)